MELTCLMCDKPPTFFKRVGDYSVIAINQKGLVQLAETQQIKTLWLGAHEESKWALFVETTEGETVILHTVHKGARYWKSLNNAIAYIARHCPSVEKISVDVAALRKRGT